MDIQKPSGRDFTYRLCSRTFDIPELKLIIDNLQSSKFLTEKSSREIIGKMEALCSKHEASQLHRKIILSNRVKNVENKISNNVGNINIAIDSGEQISFKCTPWTTSKSRGFGSFTRREGNPTTAVLLSPVQVIVYVCMIVSNNV